MEEYTNSFTKWCTDNILEEDSATGTQPSGPVLAERLDRAMGYLLNDAAQQKRGEEFDPERVTAARLEKLNKTQLITMVLNFAWFLKNTVSPLFRELQQQVSELTDSVSQSDEQIVTIQNDLIQSMQKVEKLQDALLLEKEHQMETLKSSVEDTVKTELKSYATVVKKSCAVSLAPRKLQAAIVKASSTEERSNNLILYGLEEITEENTEEAVLKVLQHTNEKPKVESCRRLGEKKEGKRRPVKVVLHNRDMVRCILARSGMLREVEGMKDVYLCPDRTVEERSERRKLVAELKQQRETNPNVRWGIVRGRVIQREKRDNKD